MAPKEQIPLNQENAENPPTSPEVGSKEATPTAPQPLALEGQPKPPALEAEPEPEIYEMTLEKYLSFLNGQTEEGEREVGAEKEGFEFDRRLAEELWQATIGDQIEKNPNSVPKEVREEYLELIKQQSRQSKPEIGTAEPPAAENKPSLEEEFKDPKFQKAADLAVRGAEVRKKIKGEHRRINQKITSPDKLAKAMKISQEEARKLIERLEKSGVITPMDADKKRGVSMTSSQLLEAIAGTRGSKRAKESTIHEALSSGELYIKCVARLLAESRRGKPFSQKGLLAKEFGLGKKEVGEIFDRLVADGLIEKKGPAMSLLPQSMAAFLKKSLAQPPATQEAETPTPKITEEITPQVESEPEVILVAPEPAPATPPETVPEKPEFDEQFIKALRSVIFSQDATEAQLKKTINVDDETASDLIKRMQSIGAIGEWRKGTRKVFWNLQQLESEIQTHPRVFEKPKDPKQEKLTPPPPGEKIVYNGEIPPAGGPETPPPISETGPLEVATEEVPPDEIPPEIAERLRQTDQATNATIEKSESPSRIRAWWWKSRRYFLPVALAGLIGGGYWTAKNWDKVSEEWNKLSRKETKPEVQKETEKTEPKQFITQEEAEALRNKATEAMAKADSAREEMKTFRTWAETPAVEEPQVELEAEIRKTPPPPTFETTPETPLSPPGEEVRPAQPKRETPEKTTARKISFTREVVGQSGLNQSQYEEIKNINVREFLKNYSDSKKYGRYGEFTSVIQMGTLREKSQLTQRKSTLANTLVKMAGPEGLKDFEKAMTVDEFLRFHSSEEPNGK